MPSPHATLFSFPTDPRRRRLLAQAAGLSSLLAAPLLLEGCGGGASAGGGPAGPEPSFTRARPLRASWVSTVLNLDWPSAESARIADDAQRVAVQQAELLRILDEAVATGLNALIFQAKPCADALYASDLLPWSPYLTGTLGRHPGFDPLAFAVEQAHARGLELHAWLNPYRVSMDVGADTVRMLDSAPADGPPSIYRTRPGWIRTAARRFVLDPGLPEVRAWLGSVVAEITSRYAVDAIHFDDYFYYETADSRLDDAQTFATYGQGFADKGDWRRHSTRLLVQGLSEQLRATSPGVRFGVSPAGVWRNRVDDPRGSDTQAGAPSYDAAFADTRQWVLDGLVDDLVPQVYWPFARQAVGYGTIARWWADVALASPGVRVHIGMALYKAGRPTAQEPDWGVEGGVPEFRRQIDLNESTPGIHGSVLFRHAFLRDPAAAAVAAWLRQRWAPAP